MQSIDIDEFGGYTKIKICDMHKIREVRKMLDRKIAFTIEEAAAYTGIGRNTMRQLVEWNKLPSLKVGRKILIQRAKLEEFLKMNEGRNLRVKEDVRSAKEKEP